MNKKLLLVLFGISGMAALIYEVTWIRPLSLVFGNTTYALSTIIASFIFGLAMGSWIAGKYTDRIKNPFEYFAFTQIGIGFYGIILLGIFSILPGLYLDMYHVTWPNQELFTFTQIIISMALLLIPTALMGATLPLLLKTYSKDLSSIGKDVGKLDASNSFGAMVGTLLAGFLLIPILGIQNSIVFAASINISIGALILISKRFSNYKKLSILGLGIVLLFVLSPSYDVETMSVGTFVNNFLESSQIHEVSATGDVLFYKESLYSTVLVIIDNDDVKRLTINGKTQCSTYPYSLESNTNLAKIPYEVYSKNYGQPNNALNIGLACGTTSKALSLNLNTTTIEIDPAVVDANIFFYDDIDMRLFIDDGRNWLFRNNEKFDLIITEIFDPYVNRNSMYSQEFFIIQSESLTENGISVQWVPFYDMEIKDVHIFFNTFHSVFPYVYAFQMSPNAIDHVIFLGSKKPLSISDNELFLFDQDTLISQDTILSTDDNNHLEFSFARNLYNPPGFDSEKILSIKKSD